MNKKALIRQLEADFEESRRNFKEGKGIPLEDFDWGLPLHIIAESSGIQYRVDDET